MLEPRKVFFEIKNNHVKKLEYFDSLGSIYIMAIVSTANDGMFFGSFDKGIYILDNNQYFQLNTENGLSSDRINCLYQTKDGLVLVGTQKGLNVIKDKKSN
ncbi:MAG: hypothetical protein H6613_06560 [Ignavibacteriales bacterium]|nr:hypothetical protein [Ignavibacteriales bacterium]